MVAGSHLGHFQDRGPKYRQTVGVGPRAALEPEHAAAPFVLCCLESLHGQLLQPWRRLISDELDRSGGDMEHRPDDLQPGCVGWPPKVCGQSACYLTRRQLGTPFRIHSTWLSTDSRQRRVTHFRRLWAQLE